ncbi:MAG: phosphotransferase [Gammaproteobacteria bacterium]|nr:phosphotransferase [Gammaproteobacteria bacterium]
MKQSLSSQQQQWISRYFPIVRYDALCGDAGFRRYFRLHMPDQSLIFMDASEEPAIYHAFIQQTLHLNGTHLPIPQVWAKDDERYWAILEDFGDDLLWTLFQPSSDLLALADKFYREAIDHLIRLHQHPIKAYGRYTILDADVIHEELHGWREWCLEGLFQKNASPALLQCFDVIANEVIQQPYIFMHRDYHSKNLLRKSDGSIGIIDYQDAMAGPMTYDIASLLRDCYVDWPEENVKAWALYYKKQAQKFELLQEEISDVTFLTWLDWTSIQRHLKALFTFSRKYLRDNNDNYLQFIPRTLRYLEEVSCRYKMLAELTTVISELREKEKW